jgi:hypothetical protein
LILGVLQPLAHAHSRTTSGFTPFCKADYLPRDPVLGKTAERRYHSLSRR